jgi:hypothetical protein
MQSLKSLKSIERDIASGFVISAIAVAMALAWGSPFVGPRVAHADEQQQVERQQEQSQAAQAAKAKPHPGTVSQHSQR